MAIQKRLHLVALILILLLPGPLAAADRWQLAGPEGGRIPALLLDPSDPQVLYAAADYGGVFKSPGSGVAWSPVNEGLRGAEVLSLAADPGHPGTIYAGDDHHRIFRSDDGGAHWSGHTVGFSMGLVTAALLVTPEAVYAVVYDSDRPTVYKSIDRGVSWSFLGLSGARTLALDPADPHLLYAGTSGSGVLHSTDGGASWTGAVEGLPDQAAVTALATLPGLGRTIYAAVEGAGVYRSTDGGSHWQRTSRGLLRAEILNLAAGPAPSTLYAVAKPGPSSGHVLYRSTDGGTHWQRAAGQGLPPDFLALTADPRGGAVYAGSGLGSTGVFRSLDGGATWSAFNHGLRAVPVDVLADPKRPGIAYISSSSSGSPLQKTLDGGASWRPLGGFAGILDLLAIDPQRPATLYLSNGSLQRSRNGGRAWEALGPGTYFLAIDPSQPSVLYRYAGAGIERSADAGETWAPDFTLPSCGSSISLAVDPSSEVFVGMSSPCDSASPFLLYKRGLDGSWKAVTGPPMTSLLSTARLAADPRQPSTLYVSVIEHPLQPVPGVFGEVFRSTDGGASWSPVPGLSNGITTALAFPAGEPGAVYAARFGELTSNVYRSVDGGKTWAIAGEGIDGEGIDGGFVLSMSAGGGNPATIYAVTYGGLYSLTRGTP